MVFIEKIFLNIKYVLNNYGWQPSCGYIFKFFILLFTLNKYTLSLSCEQTHKEIEVTESNNPPSIAGTH